MDEDGAGAVFLFFLQAGSMGGQKVCLPVFDILTLACGFIKLILILFEKLRLFPSVGTGIFKSNRYNRSKIFLLLRRDGKGDFNLRVFRRLSFKDHPPGGKPVGKRGSA